MSQEVIETARRGYAALNRAYRSGDVDEFLPWLEEQFDPDCEFVPAGVLPESRPVKGWDGLLRYTAEQMKAFEDGSMWLEPVEYLDSEDDDWLVVPYRFGGTARHTRIEVTFEFVHVFRLRDGITVRVNVYETREQALEAVGVSE
jgi:ketosteroid isomerase-like protein